MFQWDTDTVCSIVNEWPSLFIDDHWCTFHSKSFTKKRCKRLQTANARLSVLRHAYARLLVLDSPTSSPSFQQNTGSTSAVGGLSCFVHLGLWSDSPSPSDEVSNVGLPRRNAFGLVATVAVAVLAFSVFFVASNEVRDHQTTNLNAVVRAGVYAWSTCIHLCTLWSLLLKLREGSESACREDSLKWRTNVEALWPILWTHFPSKLMCRP